MDCGRGDLVAIVRLDAHGDLFFWHVYGCRYVPSVLVISDSLVGGYWCLVDKYLGSQWFVYGVFAL